jgi:hypothetical protein
MHAKVELICHKDIALWTTGTFCGVDRCAATPFVVTADIRAFEEVAVVGGSGCGGSTLRRDQSCSMHVYRFCLLLRCQLGLCVPVMCGCCFHLRLLLRKCLRLRLRLLLLGLRLGLLPRLRLGLLPRLRLGPLLGLRLGLCLLLRKCLRRGLLLCRSLGLCLLLRRGLCIGLCSLLLDRRLLFILLGCLRILSMPLCAGAGR